ncbi:MAG TPA: hypothetical protein VMF64_07245 [Steroidobacteraceae bacterium]|nr:hypothetical protein [Steroidobacteraceae bacterium]
MKPWKALVVTVSLIVSVAAFGQGSPDPAIGSWTLNVAKSRYQPGPAPQSEQRTYEATADGEIHLTIHLHTADGQSITQETIYRRDGKPHALTNNSNIDSIETFPIKGGAVRTTYFRGGKVVGNMRTSYSKDRKVLTLTQTVIRPSGETEHDVRVYDRQ